MGEVDSVQQKSEFAGAQRDAGLAGLGDGPSKAPFLEALGTDPKAAAVKDEDFQPRLLAVGEQEEVSAERILGEGVANEAEEAVTAFAHVNGSGGGEDAGGGGEAENSSGFEAKEEAFELAGDVRESVPGEFEAAAVAEDDGEELG